MSLILYSKKKQINEIVIFVQLIINIVVTIDFMLQKKLITIQNEII